MKNKILRGEYRKSMAQYWRSRSGKPIDPNYNQIKSRGVRGEIGRHPDFHIVEFLKKQHERIEETLREIPLNLQATEIKTGRVVYPPLAVSPFIDTNKKIKQTTLTPIGDYQNYSIPEIRRKIKKEEMQDEPGRLFGKVFIVNDRTFIAPCLDDVELHYRIFDRKSHKGNDVFRTIEFYFDGVPRSNFFDF